MNSATPLNIFSVDDFPEVESGAHLADLVSSRVALEDSDVVVLPATFVAIAEGRVVTPLPAGEDWQALIEQESVRILRFTPQFAITENSDGFVCIDAGITRMNNSAVLLPRDADRAAFKLRERMRALTGICLGVILSHSSYEPWRNGNYVKAIGSAGVRPIVEGNCVVDQLASAASLVGNSVAVIRGVNADLLSDVNEGVKSTVIMRSTDALFR